ncbi:MAG: M56 family metallopeptidase, partial [Candidatus Sulfotelmatobacter sp.]
IVPFVAAAVVTLALAVPSFLLLEPRAVRESTSIAALGLGFCGILLMLAGAWKAAAALVRASRTIARWSSEASAIGCSPIGSAKSISVLRAPASAVPLVVAGILRPRLWLSSAAEFVLTDHELRSALQHEVVHVRRWDNLRKLILCLVPFPGMAHLETAWREATEMAADDAAVSTASEALDLAAAVIKLSRIVPLEFPNELTTALVHSPGQSVNARVERLIAWRERQQSPANRDSFGYTLYPRAAMLVAMTIYYSQLLVQVHAATEWLVR